MYWLRLLVLFLMPAILLASEAGSHSFELSSEVRESRLPFSLEGAVIDIDLQQIEMEKIRPLYLNVVIECAGEPVYEKSIAPFPLKKTGRFSMTVPPGMADPAVDCQSLLRLMLDGAAGKVKLTGHLTRRAP